jgi:hypothetical protein
MTPTSSPQSIAQVAEQGATITAGILTGLSHALIISAAFAPAAVITAAIVGLTQIGFLIAGLFGGCGDTCVEATKIANDVTAHLQNNLQTYFSTPVRHASLQAGALNTVDFCFAALRRGCGNPSLGDAGVRCISERLVRGGSAPWCPTGTGCDYYTVYRDPIANDKAVIPDPAPPAPTNPIAVILGGGGNPASNNVASPYTGGSSMTLAAGLLVLLALFKYRRLHNA